MIPHNKTGVKRKGLSQNGVRNFPKRTRPNTAIKALLRSFQLTLQPRKECPFGVVNPVAQNFKANG